jgi:hypothetical protein
MKNILIFLLLFIGVKLNSDAQTVVAGVNYKNTLVYNGHTLYLNGAGVKQRFIFDLYTAGLYLPKNSDSANEIIACDCPTALKIVITTSLISVSYFHSSVDGWFNHALNGNIKGLEDRIDQFKKSFGNQINKGDEIIMVYHPGKGINIYKNKVYMDNIVGLDFKIALSKLWLGDNTMSKELRSALLGLD